MCEIKIKLFLLACVLSVSQSVYSQLPANSSGLSSDAASLTTNSEQMVLFERYHGDGIDNILEYVPTAAVFGLKILGVKGESSWQRRLMASVVSFGLNASVSYALKHTVRETRPDGTDNRSFPSGHTSVAFCGATTLMHEYRDVSPWIGVAGYAVATVVAVDRVRRNRHYWGDVLAGAAIGVASAEVGYLIGDWILKENRCKNTMAFSVAPTGVELMVRW